MLDPEFIRGMAPTGRIFWVIPTSHTNYVNFVAEHPAYEDGVASCYSTIQAALDACVTQRDDYVVVVPGVNFTLAAALTMTKSRVHLICPSGIRGEGAQGDVAITQGVAADLITVTGYHCEIAGFVLHGYRGEDIIDIGTTWNVNIHHNYFAMSATAGSNNYGVIGTDVIEGCVHHNVFNNYHPGAVSGTDNDIAGFIQFATGGTMRGAITDNLCMTGVNTAVAYGIAVCGMQTTIARNYVIEDQSHASAEKGTLTIGIYAANSNFVVDNRVGIETAADAIIQMDADLAVENWGIGATQLV